MSKDKKESAPIEGVKISLVCECGHTDLKGRLEVNFADKTMYFKNHIWFYPENYPNND